MKRATITFEHGEDRNGVAVVSMALGNWQGQGAFMNDSGAADENRSMAVWPEEVEGFFVPLAESAGCDIERVGLPAVIHTADCA